MKKMSFIERLREFCEVVCGLDDYDWDTDFADGITAASSASLLRLRGKRLPNRENKKNRFYSQTARIACISSTVNKAAGAFVCRKRLFAQSACKRALAERVSPQYNFYNTVKEFFVCLTLTDLPLL